MKSVVSLMNYRSQGLELNFLHICILYRNTKRALFRHRMFSLYKSFVYYANKKILRQT